MSYLLFSFLIGYSQIKVSSNQRFLVSTKDETPFFWLGDTDWELFHRLTREEAMTAAVEVATAISDVLDIYFKTDPGEAQDRLFTASDYLGQLACALLEHKPGVQP